MGQLSVISYQLSVISHRLPVITLWDCYCDTTGGIVERVGDFVNSRKSAVVQGKKDLFNNKCIKWFFCREPRERAAPPAARTSKQIFQHYSGIFDADFRRTSSAVRDKKGFKWHGKWQSSASGLMFLLRV
jgi:hypothetical protein